MTAHPPLVRLCTFALLALLLATPVASQAPATIYIYWPKQQRGGGKPKVLCDGQHVANLQNGRYIVLTAPPGAHTVKFHKGDIAATFETGKDHYIRVSAEGFPVHAVLRLMDGDEATTEMQLRELQPNDSKRTFAAECRPPASAIPKKSKDR